MDSTDISTLSKDKTSVSTNGIKTFIKKQLTIEIQRLSTANVQLITNKIKTEKAKVNLQANKTRLLREKNSLVVKREEFRAEIVTMNATGFSNVLTVKIELKAPISLQRFSAVAVV